MIYVVSPDFNSLKSTRRSGLSTLSYSVTYLYLTGFPRLLENENRGLLMNLLQVQNKRRVALA